MPWWDWPTLAAVTRNILEAYLSFYYIAVEPVSADESDLRHSVFWYHDNTEKYKLYKAWGADPSVLDPFENNLPKARQRLVDHNWFGQLTKTQQQRVVSGANACYLTRDEILKRLPFTTSEVAGFYRFLSANVHAAPFSWMRGGNERGRGEENTAERGYMALAIAFARKFIAASVIDMCNLFPANVRDKVPGAYETARAQFGKLHGSPYPEP